MWPLYGAALLPAVNYRFEFQADVDVIQVGWRGSGKQIKLCRRNTVKGILS